MAGCQAFHACSGKIFARLIFSRAGNMWENKGGRSGNPKAFGGWPFRIALGLIFAIVAAGFWFNAIFYPGFGLKELSRQDYRQALLLAGRGFANSESLSLVQSLGGNFREAPYGKAYAWGTFLLQNSKGEKFLLWVSVKWVPFWRRWQRLDCSLPADPRDKLLFAESLLFLSPATKLSYGLANVGREVSRRFREVYRGAAPSPERLPPAKFGAP